MMQPSDLDAALAELQSRKEEVERLNQELQETNIGVLALFAELDDRAIMLRNVNELKDQFLSYLSHEFRTPLNSISALSDMLLQGVSGELNTEQRTQAQFIRKSSLDLLDMVNDLLDLAKIESGHVDVRVETVVLEEVFAGLRGVLRPLVQSDEIELVFEDASAIPLMETDANKLTQILRNLVSNALKFTERGEVRVSATLLAGDRVLLEVADTGIGIEQAEQQRIFEAFAQVDSPLQRRVTGTGLGLSLSRKLATVLGGTLSLESEPGVGSRFSVELPLFAPVASLNATSERTRRVDTDAMPSLAGVHVLIVDDDAAARYVLRAGLEPAGAIIEEVDNGSAAIGRVGVDTFDVIVLDLAMPGMQGQEVLATLHDENPGAIPIVIHTSQILTDAERADLERMAHAVVAKGPGHIAHLAAAIATAAKG